jgi:hypothetical protein
MGEKQRAQGDAEHEGGVRSRAGVDHGGSLRSNDAMTRT